MLVLIGTTIKIPCAQTNVYNGLDTRVGSTTNSVANTYLRDGAYVTDAVLKDSTATFTPGVSERRGATTTFSHSGLKNADAQTGVSQAVNATQQYDAFGNLASSSGTWQGQFGYGGGFGYQQDATGLKLLGHRYYDSSTGRFLTRDPIKDGRNWYGYVGNDPLGGADVDSFNLTVIVDTEGQSHWDWAAEWPFGAGGTTLRNPSKEMLIEALINEPAGGKVMIWGHGAAGMIVINDKHEAYLDTDEVLFINKE